MFANQPVGWLITIFKNLCQEKNAEKNAECRTPSVTGYGFRQREKGRYLNVGILGEFVEEGFKDRFERLISSAFIQGVNN